MIACSGDTRSAKKIDLQGHRGARGLYPENSIPAFIGALDMGVHTLEMDLAVSADGQLIVSHEPYMSAELCLDPRGAAISDTSQYRFNIYQMTSEEIKAFDCGSKVHPRFPEQKKMTAYKPLLTEVINAVEDYIRQKNLPSVAYNLEIKSQPQWDNVYHPAPEDFSELVYHFIHGLISWDRVTIQSFDFRILQYFHKNWPDVNLALLIENDLSFQANLDSLGFRPAIYSCYYKLLTAEVVDQLHHLGIKVIPWTVNEAEEMKLLMGWGVDGLITDYPNRFPVR